MIKLRSCVALSAPSKGFVLCCGEELVHALSQQTLIDCYWEWVDFVIFNGCFEMCVCFLAFLLHMLGWRTIKSGSYGSRKKGHYGELKGTIMSLKKYIFKFFFFFKTFLSAVLLHKNKQKSCIRQRL